MNTRNITSECTSVDKKVLFVQNKIGLFIKRVSQASIVKVFSFNAVGTLVRMCTGFVSTKVVASIIGPSGVAILGQLNSLNSMLQGLAAGGIGRGVTKYLAENKEDDKKVKSYISNALKISTFFTTVISLVCIFGHNLLSRKVMMSDEYGYVFFVLGCTIFLFTMNTLLINILNGFKEFKRYVAINISSSVLGLIFSVTLCLLWGLKGAMISAVTFQSVVLLVTVFQCRKCSWFRREYFFAKYDRAIIRQYLQYTLMVLTTLSIVPVTQMMLRGYVISEISAVEAGWWEGVNRISGVYLSVITTSLTVYVLPSLSELHEKWAIKQELIKCYKLVVPLLLVCTIVIYVMKHFIVWLLFTPEFYPMESLFIWRLIGDFFKIISWLLAFLMLAKARTKLFIGTEIGFGFLMLGISYLLVQEIGVVGLNIGYMIHYIIYFIAMVIAFKDIVFCRKSCKD